MGAEALKVAREKAQALDPRRMAQRSGVSFEGSDDAGVFDIRFLGESVRITWPALELAADTVSLPDHVLALLLFYLAGSDGTAPLGKLISFAELPDARFYVQAFRGYTGAVLVRTFGDDSAALDVAAARVGGEVLSGVADRAWRIVGLPLVPITLAWWEGDDEFEPRAEFLFDTTASHHLTTDGCAVLGSWLTTMLRR